MGRDIPPNVMPLQFKTQHNTRKDNKMTLEEFKKLGKVTNADARPSEKMTNKSWQTEFELRKMLMKDYSTDRNIKFGGKLSAESGKTTIRAYHGATNWQQYCSYINDILTTIRMGKRDFCYYIYQIVDLLKIQHDDLCTRYCDGYWEVWLDV